MYGFEIQAAKQANLELTVDEERRPTWKGTIAQFALYYILCEKFIKNHTV